MNKNSKYLLQNKWSKKPSPENLKEVLSNKYGDDINDSSNLIQDEDDDNDNDQKFSQLWPIELNRNFI